jgi:flagellar basal-body rod protein FlgB
MGDLSFGQTVGMLKDALQGASAAQSVYANNVANVNTPNFRRSEVSFKEALANVDRVQPDSDELQMVSTDPRHFGALDPSAETFSITTTVDDAEQMRVDGSNVDVDQEMAKLSINSAYHQTMEQLLQTQYTRLRRAITDTLS